MNNKIIGTEFEREFCEWLCSLGYWVHFLVPNAQGAQPFDVLAVRNGKAFAFDCKTCEANTFSISRLEENQKSAFDLWIEKGNTEPMIAIKHKEKLILILYSDLKQKGTIRL